MIDKIVIKGARVHNLKNVDLEIPRDKLVVFTGLSGSGKSSLAFDTLYAEGQRRYVESLSAYARQFLGQMNKPNVDLSVVAYPRCDEDRLCDEDLGAGGWRAPGHASAGHKYPHPVYSQSSSMLLHHILYEASAVYW